MDNLPPELAEWLRTPHTSALPDYSYAGYHGGANLPTSCAARVFPVRDFGAIPDDGRDDVAAIQRAIDAAAAAGGGIVLCERGIYDFDVNSRGQHLQIRSSNIILRGAGSGVDGTIWRDHRWHDSPVPGQLWQANQIPSFIHVGPCTAAAANAQGYVPPACEIAEIRSASRHAREIEATSSQLIEVGATYLLTQFDGDGSLVEALARPLQLAQMASRRRQLGCHKFKQLITVAAKEGNTLILDAPLLFELREEWQPRLWAFTQPLLQEVGIEGLRLQGKFTRPFRHHEGVEMDDGWNHIRCDGVVHGWIRDVVHEDATYAVLLASCKNFTIEECRITGHTGHNGYSAIGAATRNLFSHLDAGNQFHKFQLQGYASGNVFWQCTGSPQGGIDCHGGLGIYNLFDCLHNVGIQHGGARHSTPPRCGIGLTLWNCYPPLVLDHYIPSPIIVNGIDGNLEPRSLYEFQRARRMDLR